LKGFAVGVQPTADAVCVVLPNYDFGSAKCEAGNLRRMKFNELSSSGDGSKYLRLLDLLDISVELIGVELVGEPGWKNALSAVEASNSLGRVFFSSLEHSEILQLWAACPKARCGFIWQADEADAITDEEISFLPEALLLQIPTCSVRKRSEFWNKCSDRLVRMDDEQ
jgi:glycerophosphoryl diester phosphodiesterase